MGMECDVSIVVPIIKGKGDIRNCSCYGAVKLLGHGMMVVEKVLEKRLCIMVSVDEMQFDFLPKRETIDAVFILRRLQEEYRARGKKLYTCHVDLEKALVRVSRKVLEWALKKKEIPEGFVRSVMSLYEEAKTRVRVDSELSDEFEAKVGISNESV